MTVNMLVGKLSRNNVPETFSSLWTKWSISLVNGLIVFHPNTNISTNTQSSQTKKTFYRGTINNEKYNVFETNHQLDEFSLRHENYQGDEAEQWKFLNLNLDQFANSNAIFWDQKLKIKSFLPIFIIEMQFSLKEIWGVLQAPLLFLVTAWYRYTSLKEKVREANQIYQLRRICLSKQFLKKSTKTSRGKAFELWVCFWVLHGRKIDSVMKSGSITPFHNSLKIWVKSHYKSHVNICIF